MRQFDASGKIEEIVAFMKETFNKTKIGHAVIAWSGGIDSTVSLYLLSKTLPVENITVLHLPYETTFRDKFTSIQSGINLPEKNFRVVPIKNIVDTVWNAVRTEGDANEAIRKGNIMARTRMVLIYDEAKKRNALVCGTENRTEELLGYFTRFGDEASDIEPIRSLYKSEVFGIAKALGVPNELIRQAPSAGLWNGQTDEGEFGFSYAEADEVLHRYYDMKQTESEIERAGFANTSKIIGFSKKNAFKHDVPYSL